MIVFGVFFAISLQYNQTPLLWHCSKRRTWIHTSAKIAGGCIISRAIIQKQLLTSNRLMSRSASPSKTHRIDGRSANLASGRACRQRVGPLTGHLRHHCLRDPPVPQERFDLLLHHAAVPPANTHTHTLSSGESESESESEDALVHYESRVGILRQRHFQRRRYFGWIKRAAAKSQVADETKEGVVVCEMKNPDVPCFMDSERQQHVSNLKRTIVGIFLL